MNHNTSFFKTASWLGLVLILVRLVTLNFPDLVDTTEGRYAGVAQIMLERDDWVTPWIHYRGVDKPYLGKPPLHFWLMQTSYLVFGHNNFAARFPGLFSTVGIGLTVWVGCNALLGAEAALVALAVFGSSCMVFFLAGAALLDMTLTLGVSVALMGFILADRKKIYGLLFFAGMGLGVLVKGPLACILTLGVAFPWAVVSRYTLGRWPTQVICLPWRMGIALFAAIVVPWYWWAEIRNPGFLRYFLINENFGRYLQSDYGDIYGSGHRQPFGAAWGMLVLAETPWSFLFIALLGISWRKWLKKKTISAVCSDPTLLFAMAWCFSCPVLLLGAHQYTATYLCPSLPGFAVLAATLWSRRAASQWVSEAVLLRCLRVIGLLLGTVGIVIALVSMRYEAPLLFVGLTIVSCVAGAISVVLATSSLQSITRVSVIATVLFACLTLAFNNHLSTNRSSRRVLALANTFVPNDQPLRIGFANYFPFSARFYAPQLGRAVVETRNIDQDHPDAAGLDLIVARARNMEAVLQEHPNVQEVARLGQWRVLRPSSQ